MPATPFPGHILIDIPAGQKTYLNLIYSGPGHFVCPLTDSSIPMQIGSWTSCGQAGGPVTQALPGSMASPLNQGRYRLDITHDMGPCVAPQGAIALDMILRQQVFGPEMFSFTMGKTGRPDIVCDIVVVMQAAGSGGGSSRDTGGRSDRQTNVPSPLPSPEPSFFTRIIRKLIKRRRPVPPIPPTPPFKK